MRQGSTLYWLVSDHLGSTSVTANASGSLYGRLLYKAWGEQRWSSGTTPTTYRYTGQRSESSLGLYYYGARWYDPNLSRWLQPDSIVPNKYNPLDLDRYSYVRNNPVNYIDPSGHQPCFEDGYCPNGTYSEINHIRYLARQYGIKFTGVWEQINQWAVIAGAQAMAYQFASAMGSAVQPALAFRDVYGISGNDKFNFEWGCNECTAMGFTPGTRHVKFREMYQEAADLRRNAGYALFMNTTLVVHELFHAFENAMQVTLEDGTKYKQARSTLPSRFSRDGLAGPYKYWQQSPENTPGEIYADMGVGWIFNQWNTNPYYQSLAVDMSEWMTNNMFNFINIAINNQR